MRDFGCALFYFGVKMMKRTVRVLSLILSIIIIALCFVSCSDNVYDNEETLRIQHYCSYDKKETIDKYKYSDATCTKKAEYYYSCECGEKGFMTFQHGELAEHIYLDGECVGCGYLNPTSTIPDTPTQPESESRFVFITPTGARYHYLMTCAGKNASLTTIDRAIKSGYTGCKKCTK